MHPSKPRCPYRSCSLPTCLSYHSHLSLDVPCPVSVVTSGTTLHSAVPVVPGKTETEFRGSGVLTLLLVRFPL